MRVLILFVVVVTMGLACAKGWPAHAEIAAFTAAVMVSVVVEQQTVSG